MFFGSFQIVSQLDSQSELQMFTLFSGRHICAEQFDEYLNFKTTHTP